jgi:cytochrome c
MKLMIAGIVAAGLLFALQPPPRGQDLFARRCSGCHALDINKEGPRLRGVYGRRAASIADFDYSDALKKAGGTWDAVTLDRWLTDPDALAAGTDMAFRMIDESERRAVIEYLKTLSAIQSGK